MTRAGIHVFFLTLLLASHSIRADRRAKTETTCLGLEGENQNRSAILNSQACGFNGEDSAQLAPYLGKLTHLGAGAQGELCIGTVSTNPPTPPSGQSYKVGRFKVKQSARWTPKKDEVLAVKGWCTDNKDDYSLKEMTTEASIMSYLTLVPQVVNCWQLATSDHKVDKCEKMAFLAMEGIFGGDLQGFLKDASVTPEASAKLFFDAYMGVKTMHEYGVIHRDLKPANIMKVQGADKVKIIDFGSACCVSDHHVCNAIDSSLACTPQKNQEGYTPYYMSPELFLGAVMPDKADDLWALGLVAYQMFVHQDTWFLKKKLFNSAENILALGQNIVNVEALQQKIEEDFATKKKNYPHMKEFLKTSLSKIPSERDLPSQALQRSSTCESTEWCKEWMTMGADEWISQPVQSEQDHSNSFDARVRPDATQQSGGSDDFDESVGLNDRTQ